MDVWITIFDQFLPLFLDRSDGGSDSVAVHPELFQSLVGKCRTTIGLTQLPDGLSHASRVASGYRLRDDF